MRPSPFGHFAGEIVFALPVAPIIPVNQKHLTASETSLKHTMWKLAPAFSAQPITPSLGTQVVPVDKTIPWHIFLPTISVKFGIHCMGLSAVRMIRRAPLEAHSRQRLTPCATALIEFQCPCNKVSPSNNPGCTSIPCLSRRCCHISAS